MNQNFPVRFHDNTQNDGVGFFQLKIIFRDVSAADIGARIIETDYDAYAASAKSIRTLDTRFFPFDIDSVSGQQPVEREDEKTITITADEDESGEHFEKFNTLAQKIENAGASIDHIEVMGGMRLDEIFRVVLKNVDPSDLPLDCYFNYHDEKSGEIVAVYHAPGCDQEGISAEIAEYIPQAKILSVQSMSDYLKSQPVTNLQPT